MDLRIENQPKAASIAPKRPQAPTTLEELFLPHSVRERVFIASIHTAIKQMELALEKLRASTDDDLIVIFVNCVKGLQRAFHDTTGVEWKIARELFP